MQAETESPVDVSVEAALELEELKQGLRDDAPALSKLFEILRSRSPAFAGNGVCMLSDVQSYYLRREPHTRLNKIAVGENLKTLVERFLSELEKGVAARKLEKIDEAKNLCLAVNGSLLARKLDDIYSRKERSDSRYINHEFSS
jgi:hypothetical protein